MKPVWSSNMVYEMYMKKRMNVYEANMMVYEKYFDSIWV